MRPNLKLTTIILLFTLLLTSCPSNTPPKTQGKTVTGKVLSYDGKAAGFLPILVNDQKTATDANGNFTIANVSVPYNLVILKSSENAAYVYQGLNQLNPIALVSNTSAGSTSKAEVTFNSSNVDTVTPVPAGGLADAHLGCIGVDTQQVSCGVTGSILPTYKGDISWAGATIATINAYTLQMHKNDRNVATNFLRFGKTENIVLQNGQPSTVNTALEPVVNQAIAGTVTPPPGYTLVGRALGFKPLGKTLYPFSYELDKSGINNIFNWVSPAIPGMPLYLTGTAEKNESSVYAYLDVLPNDVAVDLALPTPPEQSSPDNNALGVSFSTQFSWTPFEAGVHIISFSPVTPGPLSIIVYTAATETTIPDLSDLGYPLAKGQVYRWVVSGLAPFSSADNLVNGVPYLNVLQSAGYSGERIFTTTP